jgi:hypothetical protein
MLISIDAELSGIPLSDQLDRGCRGHDKSESSRRAHFQPADLFIGQTAIGMALLVGKGSKYEPVFHRWPVCQGQWLEEFGV